MLLHPNKCNILIIADSSLFAQIHYATPNNRACLILYVPSTVSLVSMLGLLHVSLLLILRQMQAR
jgi:hypothetical protein